MWLSDWRIDVGLVYSLVPAEGENSEPVTRVADGGLLLSTREVAATGPRVALCMVHSFYRAPVLVQSNSRNYLNKQIPNTSSIVLENRDLAEIRGHRVTNVATSEIPMYPLKTPLLL